MHIVFVKFKQTVVRISHHIVKNIAQQWYKLRKKGLNSVFNGNLNLSIYISVHIKSSLMTYKYIIFLYHQNVLRPVPNTHKITKRNILVIAGKLPIFGVSFKQKTKIVQNLGRSDKNAESLQRTFSNFWNQSVLLVQFCNFINVGGIYLPTKNWGTNLQSGTFLWNIF